MKKRVAKNPFIDTIKGGGAAIGKSEIMPAWEKTLTNEEMKALDKYVMTFVNADGRYLMMKEGNNKTGPAIFLGTLIIVLIYFWWFLLYSHGVRAVH